VAATAAGAAMTSMTAVTEAVPAAATLPSPSRAAGNHQTDAAHLCDIGGFADAAIKIELGACDPRAQRVVDDEEEARALVKIPGDALHGRHALGQQCEVRTIETDAAVVSFAQPVIERLSQAHAVTRFGHRGTAEQRVAGAIDVFG